ncbi:MAG: TIGR04283 family arsenosugar biosynthesis glycosyltransferase [Verrucomicrobiota bacterium]
MAVAQDRLIIFTRLPQAGKSKTRLIPALGEAGAAAFHDRLARHTVGRASAFAACRKGLDLELRVSGGTTMDGRAWLGDASWKIQADGGLGEKLLEAVSSAFEEGASKVVVIGTDCPSLDESGLETAFDELDRHEAVVGPAKDGGYYLIGMRSLHERLFESIPWGGSEVFARTMERAVAIGLSMGILPSLPDVDIPEDLPAAEAALDAGERVSVIIPTLNEGDFIEETLVLVNEGEPYEVLVADGGSKDQTVPLAKAGGARVFSGKRGRGPQMNLAAAEAKGEFLFFLHADSLPPDGYVDSIRRMLNRPEVSAGSFRLGLRGELGAASLIETLVDLRCRYLSWPYGDQGIFLRRSVFQSLGGFPEETLLEDVGLISELRRVGRIELAPERVLSSDRRWQDQGLVRSFLRHQILLASHALGLSFGR